MSWKNSRRLMAKFALAKRKRCESLLETLGSVKLLGNLSDSLPLRQADGHRYGFDHHACEARSNDSVCWRRGVRLGQRVASRAASLVYSAETLNIAKGLGQQKKQPPSTSVSAVLHLSDLRKKPA